jgi:hypothetical protein
LQHTRSKDLEAGHLKTLAKIIGKSEGEGRTKRVTMNKKIKIISSECKIKK